MHLFWIVVRHQPPPVRLPFNRALLVLTALTLAWVAPAAARAQDQALLRFDADTPLELQAGESTSTVVFNDSPEALTVTARALLDPAKSSGDSLRVPVTFDGASDPPNRAEVGSGGMATLEYDVPANATPGANGWLTLIGQSDGERIVVRRAAKVAAPSPQVETWQVVSRQWLPGTDDGDHVVGQPLPLAPTSDDCGELTPTTVLVSGDDTVAVKTRCVGGDLQLIAEDASPGEYKGKLKVGAASVELQLRRTMTVLWPIALILLGIVLALLTQGRTAQGWYAQQVWWLWRLPGKAAEADAQYTVAAQDQPWESYALEPVIAEENDATRDALRTIKRSVPFQLRYLPWPENFMAEERAAVLKRIVAMQTLVKQWPSMPAVFAAAQTRVSAQQYYLTRAQKLVQRILLILGAGGGRIDAAELTARCAEARALPAAADVIDDLERLAAYLAELESSADVRPPADARVLARARQLERQASATLAELSDSTKVPSEVGVLVDRAARLAARLPKPGPAPRGEDEITPETVAPLVELLTVPLSFVARIPGAIRGGGIQLGMAGVIVLTLAVGVLTGLAAIYYDKVWGDDWTDYAAAVVWGYAASTVIDPLVGAVRQLGARPGDGPAEAAK